MVQAKNLKSKNVLVVNRYALVTECNAATQYSELTGAYERTKRDYVIYK